MGKFGFHSGSVIAQNLQAGSASVDTDGSGDGTSAVVFKRKMKHIPKVVLTSQTSDNTVTLAAINVTVNGFTIDADGAEQTSSITVAYIAMDDN